MPHVSIGAIHDAVVGTTAPQLFLKLVGEHPDLPALHSMKSDAPGSWQVWTLHDYADMTARAAAGLQLAGLAPGERILLLMRNRPEFHWFDLAAQFLRATPVSIYNSSSPEEIQFLAEHAEARIAIVENATFLDRLISVRHELPLLEQIYVLDPPADGYAVGVQHASVLMDKGSADLTMLAAAIQPDDIATLIYTSGTTGPPKGVMISHYNVVYTVESLRQCFGLDSFIGRRVVSYLPMAHIAERMMSHYQAIILGYSVFCCPDANQLPVYLKEVHPEIVFGVPRVWEKIYNGVNAALSRDPESKAKFDEGVAAARAIKAAEIKGGATQKHRDTWAFLDAVAFANVRLDRARRHRHRRVGRRGHPAFDPRVVQRDRCAAQRDLWDERVERSDDVEPEGQSPRIRRSSHPRLRGRARRRQRGVVPRWQRLRRVLQTARPD